MLPRSRVFLALPLAVLLGLPLLSACGGSSGSKGANKSSNLVAPKWRVKDCQPAGSHGSSSYQLCWRPVGKEHGAFVSVKGGVKASLHLSRPGPTKSSPKYAGQSGHWFWAALSPDGREFLAQWSGDCEIPTSFFVPLSGGKPVPVTGESDWLKSPAAEAFGWTPDGRAIVFFPHEPACGSNVYGRVPGVYLVESGSKPRLLRSAKELGPLKRSLKPRTPAQLRAILARKR